MCKPFDDKLRENDMVKSLLALLLCMATPMVTHAQDRTMHRAPDRELQAYLDSIQTQAPKPGEQKNIIVEFTGEPMFLARLKSPGLRTAVSAAPYLSRFSQFAADAEALQRLFHATPSDHLTIRRQFYKAFFGVSMTVPGWMLPMIQHLEYVKALHFDRTVQATVDSAFTLIGAPAAWVAFGTQGEGIRIGIIDTGIDYLHPALGGGFGAGFKVAGGYDIVNNDNDPMDDNGHGTHVAGIVAASFGSGGTLGIAPDALSRNKSPRSSSSASAAWANRIWRGAKRPGVASAPGLRTRKNVTWKPSAASPAARARSPLAIRVNTGTTGANGAAPSRIMPAAIAFGTRNASANPSVRAGTRMKLAATIHPIRPRRNASTI